MCRPKIRLKKTAEGKPPFPDAPDRELQLGMLVKQHGDTRTN